MSEQLESGQQLHTTKEIAEIFGWTAPHVARILRDRWYGGEKVQDPITHHYRWMAPLDSFIYNFNRRTVRQSHNEIDTCSNCIGYVFSKLGITGDTFQGLPTLEELADMGLEACQNLPEAETLAVLLAENSTIVTHMAFIDKENPKYVWQRHGVGMNVGKLTLSLFEIIYGTNPIVPLRRSIYNSEAVQ